MFSCPPTAPTLLLPKYMTFPTTGLPQRRECKRPAQHTSAPGTRHVITRCTARQRSSSPSRSIQHGTTKTLLYILAFLVRRSIPLITLFVPHHYPHKYSNHRSLPTMKTKLLRVLEMSLFHCVPTPPPPPPHEKKKLAQPTYALPPPAQAHLPPKSPSTFLPLRRK